MLKKLTLLLFAMLLMVATQASACNTDGHCEVIKASKKKVDIAFLQYKLCKTKKGDKGDCSEEYEVYRHEVLRHMKFYDSLHNPRGDK